MRDGEPYIIALNGAQLTCARNEAVVPRVVRAVFGIGDLVVTIDRESRLSTGESFEPMNAVEKKSGASVQTVHFRDAQFAGISALLWGTADLYHRPDFRGRDIISVHNSFATAKLPCGWFPEGIEYRAEDNVSVPRRYDHWKERTFD